MVSAIILSNSATEKHYQMTKKCLQSLRQCGGTTWSVVVVEQQEVKDHFGDPTCKVIQAPGPFHYNRFLRYGWEALGEKCSDVLAVLNNDLVFQPGFWEPLCEGLRRFDSVSPWCPVYHDRHMLPGHLYYSGYRPAYEIAGWALFMTASMLGRIGFDELFPEDFAAWYQDNWYSYQLQRHDCRHALVSDSRVVHLFGGSADLIESTGKAEQWSHEAKSIYDAKVNAVRGGPNMLLTVGVVSIPERSATLSALLADLNRQAEGKPVEVLVLTDNKQSTVGRKRDFIVQMAKGQYLSMVDDDDEVAPDYVDSILAAIRENPGVDVVTFNILIRGDMEGVTYYSEDNRDDLDAGIFYRKPNHLCAWSTEIARKIRYRDVSYGEDHDWGTAARTMIRERVNIPRNLYVYNMRQQASQAQRPSTRFDRDDRPEQPIQRLLPAMMVAPADRKLRIAVYAIAKNEAKHAERWAKSAEEADLRFVADTGSTDGTQEVLLQNGVMVGDICIKPWRFDAARNAALAMLPDWVDVCISLDLDEVLEPGWRIALERAWGIGTTRLWHTFKFSPKHSYRLNRIHARCGYQWRWPVHELLDKIGGGETCAESLDLTMTNLPDVGKPRNYLPILLDAASTGDARMLWYLGREYAYFGQWREARDACERFLASPDATWPPERWDAMRRIAASWKEEGDHLRALAVLKRACLEHPGVREPLVDLARLQYDLRQYHAGLSSAVDAIAVTERPFHFLVDPDCWGYLPHDLAAICSWNIGAKEESAKHAKAALSLDPPPSRMESLTWMATGKKVGAA